MPAPQAVEPQPTPVGKKRRKQGPRTQRPVFAVVRYSDENGPVQLDQNRLNIQIERDSAKLVEMLTGGGDFTGAAVVKVELPQPKPREATAGQPA